MIGPMVWNTGSDRALLYLPSEADAAEIEEVEKVIALQVKTWRRGMEEKNARWPFQKPRNP